MPKHLKNAVVVITGASSGIGHAAALAFARQGANLFLAARKEDALRQVAAECSHFGVQATPVVTDVTDAPAVIRLAQVAAERSGGRIDVWINNAGVGAIGEFTATPIEAHEQVIRTNLLGYIYGAYAVLPYFRRRRTGVLINTNSEGGLVPAPYAVAYTASKFGLRGFSAALRGELNRWPGIRVCDVFPAFIDTPGLRHAANYVGREVKPLPPLYDPELVAQTMVSLARSPRDEVIVGQAATAARIGYFFFPRLVERGVARLARSHFQHAREVPLSDGNLFEPPADEPGIHGGWRSPPRQRISGLAAASLVAAAVAGCCLWSREARVDAPGVR